MCEPRQDLEKACVLVVLVENMTAMVTTVGSI